MSMFKKILSYFREEIEIIEEETEKNEIKSEKPEIEQKQLPVEPPSSAVKNKRSIPVSSSWPAAHQISTRVAYRYPTLKRSDHEETPRYRRQPRWIERETEEAGLEKRHPALKQISYEEAPRYRRQPRRTERDDAEETVKLPNARDYQPLYTSSSRVAPRPFQPTEIPSPIYGFRDRPLKEEEADVQEERQPRNESLLLFPTEQASRYSEPEKLIKKEPVQQPALKEAPALSVSEPKETEQVPSVGPSKPRQRRHTPFNVVMLKKDREKLAVPALKPKVVPQEKPVVQAEPAEQQEQSVVQAGTAEQQEPLFVQAEMAEEQKNVSAPFEEVEPIDRPPLSFLTPPVENSADDAWVDEKASLLNETLKSFNIDAEVTGVTTGPAITRFEVTPSIGVKVSKIVSLTDDIKRSLAARTIRIEAPIPGTQVVGIELPNDQSRPVFLSEIIGHNEFQRAKSPLASALGLDIAGNPVVLDLQKMPHGLIAGATGSGKSVCINSILVSLLYKAAPHELKLLLIDPKMVELTPYNGVPHLASPVITDVKTATAALKWAVEEMERRYQLFVHAGVRDMTSYNAKVSESEFNEPHLPYLVIVIDELADLMMMAPGEVEESICRIAQKARACGIHLIVATQRPSVDVITGLIKANIPTRIAFSVSSQIDSRTILDKVGAEKLLGKGDMLFLNNGASEAVRLQGTFVTNEEIDEVVRYVSEQQKPAYLFKQEELLQKAAVHEEEDELFQEACELVVRQGGASTSMLQRHLKVGYNRAARLIEMMEAQGLVSGQRAGRPREVLISEEEFFASLEELN